MSILKVMSQRPIEAAATVVLVALGGTLAWLSTKVSGPGYSTILNIAAVISSVVGGTLASFTASTVNSNERAAELLRPQLSQANMNLANVVYQVGKSIKDYADGSIDSATAMILVNRNYDSLRSTITIYEQITGQDVEVDRVKKRYRAWNL